jgi:hypothetical protein
VRAGAGLRNARLRSAVLAAALLLAACGPDASVLRVARAYETYNLSGDFYSVTELLAREDIALFGDGYRALLYRGVGMKGRDATGVRLDSLRLIRRRADTAAVEVFLSEPDWTQPGWWPYQRHKWYPLTARAWERMVDSLAPGLPAQPVRDTLNLVRQDGAWRVRLFLHVRERIRAAAHRVAFGDRSPDDWLGILRPWQEQRAAVAHFEDVAREAPRLVQPMYREWASEAESETLYADSVTVVAARLVGDTAIVTIDNRSARRLARVDVALVDARGRGDSVSAHDVAPHHRTTFREEVIFPEEMGKLDTAYVTTTKVQ